ncbi:hypothetical protein [Motiliproteus sp.]|uniref:hypothetical protein n=1 Tax=Motiliproteus sp. TaxID=1898955 RepID=UPI003BACCDF6
MRWPYPVNTDFISLAPIRRDSTGRIQAERLRVGTPYGNEGFASQMLGVPIEQFDLAELDELVLMLLRGRVDLIWFERAALHQALEALSQHPAIYFQQAPAAPIPLGLALRRDSRGDRIKQQLEQALSEMRLPPIPARMKQLNGLGASGVIPAKPGR